MYGAGAGVQQDDVAAYMWYTVATDRLSLDQRDASAGARTRAVEARAALARRMRPADVAEAERLAREWRPARR